MQQTPAQLNQADIDMKRMRKQSLEGEDTKKGKKEDKTASVSAPRVEDAKTQEMVLSAASPRPPTIGNSPSSATSRPQHAPSFAAPSYNPPPVPGIDVPSLTRPTLTTPYIRPFATPSLRPVMIRPVLGPLLPSKLGWDKEVEKDEKGASTPHSSITPPHTPTGTTTTGTTTTGTTPTGPPTGSSPCTPTATPSGTPTGTSTTTGTTAIVHNASGDKKNKSQSGGKNSIPIPTPTPHDVPQLKRVRKNSTPTSTPHDVPPSSSPSVDEKDVVILLADEEVSASNKNSTSEKSPAAGCRTEDCKDSMNGSKHEEMDHPLRPPPKTNVLEEDPRLNTGIVEAGKYDTDTIIYEDKKENMAFEGFIETPIQEGIPKKNINPHTSTTTTSDLTLVKEVIRQFGGTKPEEEKQEEAHNTTSTTCDTEEKRQEAILTEANGIEDDDAVIGKSSGKETRIITLEDEEEDTKKERNEEKKAKINDIDGDGDDMPRIERRLSVEQAARPKVNENVRVCDDSDDEDKERKRSSHMSAGAGDSVNSISIVNSEDDKSIVNSEDDKSIVNGLSNQFVTSTMPCGEPGEEERLLQGQQAGRTRYIEEKSTDATTALSEGNAGHNIEHALNFDSRNEYISAADAAAAAGAAAAASAAAAETQSSPGRENSSSEQGESESKLQHESSSLEGPEEPDEEASIIMGGEHHDFFGSDGEDPMDMESFVHLQQEVSPMDVISLDSPAHNRIDNALDSLPVGLPVTENSPAISRECVAASISREYAEEAENKVKGIASGIIGVLGRLHHNWEKSPKIFSWAPTPAPKADDSDDDGLYWVRGGQERSQGYFAETYDSKGLYAPYPIANKSVDRDIGPFKGKHYLNYDDPQFPELLPQARRKNTPSCEDANTDDEYELIAPEAPPSVHTYAASASSRDENPEAAASSSSSSAMQQHAEFLHKAIEFLRKKRDRYVRRYGRDHMASIHCESTLLQYESMLSRDHHEEACAKYSNLIVRIKDVDRRTRKVPLLVYERELNNFGNMLLDSIVGPYEEDDLVENHDGIGSTTKEFDAWSTADGAKLTVLQARKLFNEAYERIRESDAIIADRGLDPQDFSSTISRSNRVAALLKDAEGGTNGNWILASKEFSNFGLMASFDKFYGSNHIRTLEVHHNYVVMWMKIGYYDQAERNGINLIERTERNYARFLKEGIDVAPYEKLVRDTRIVMVNSMFMQAKQIMSNAECLEQETVNMIHEMKMQDVVTCLRKACGLPAPQSLTPPSPPHLTNGSSSSSPRVCLRACRLLLRLYHQIVKQPILAWNLLQEVVDFCGHRDMEEPPCVTPMEAGETTSGWAQQIYKLGMEFCTQANLPRNGDVNWNNGIEYDQVALKCFTQVAELCETRLLVPLRDGGYAVEGRMLKRNRQLLGQSHYRMAQIYIKHDSDYHCVADHVSHCDLALLTQDPKATLIHRGVEPEDYKLLVAFFVQKAQDLANVDTLSDDDFARAKDTYEYAFNRYEIQASRNRDAATITPSQLKASLSLVSTALLLIKLLVKRQHLAPYAKSIVERVIGFLTEWRTREAEDRDIRARRREVEIMEAEKRLKNLAQDRRKRRNGNRNVISSVASALRDEKKRGGNESEHASARSTNGRSTPPIVSSVAPHVRTEADVKAVVEEGAGGAALNGEMTLGSRRRSENMNVDEEEEENIKIHKDKEKERGARAITTNQEHVRESERKDEDDESDGIYSDDDEDGSKIAERDLRNHLRTLKEHHQTESDNAGGRYELPSALSFLLGLAKKNIEEKIYGPSHPLNDYVSFFDGRSADEKQKAIDVLKDVIRERYFATPLSAQRDGENHVKRRRADDDTIDSYHYRVKHPALYIDGILCYARELNKRL